MLKVVATNLSSSTIELRVAAKTIAISEAIIKSFIVFEILDRLRIFQ